MQAQLVGADGARCAGEIEIWIDDAQGQLNWRAHDQVIAGSDCALVGGPRTGSSPTPGLCCDATVVVPYASMTFRMRIRKDWRQ